MSFSNAFLEPIEKAKIQIINIHPALARKFEEIMLTESGCFTIGTGEFDGVMAIERAFRRVSNWAINTRTGITVHYVN